MSSAITCMYLSMRYRMLCKIIFITRLWKATTLGHKRKKKKKRIKTKKDGQTSRGPEVHEEPLKYVKRHGPLWLPLLPLPFWDFFFFAPSVPSIISSTAFIGFNEPGHGVLNAGEPTHIIFREFHSSVILFSVYIS